jgi:hypothetical protein
MYVLVQVEGGDDHDRHRVIHVGAGQQPGRLDAVQLGDANVEQADVRTELMCQGHRFAPVRRFADDFDVGLSVEDSS